MKKHIFLLLFLIQTFIIYGQRGYYVKDSSIIVGVKLFDGGPFENSRQCQLISNGKSIIFSPEEVKEYGFDDNKYFINKVYVSRTITLNDKETKVFLEKISQGKINLYYYMGQNGSKFYIEKDSGQLVELHKRNKSLNNESYKNVIKPYIQDCDKVTDALTLVTFNRPSLSKFFDQYNSCTLKPFPFIRYGITAGQATSDLVNSRISSNIVKDAVFNTDRSFNIGLFADFPIFPGYFSIHPEIYFQKNTFSSHTVFDEHLEDMITGAYDINLNSTSVNIPVLVRYTYPSLKFRPFINIGGTFAFNIKNENAIFVSTITPDKVEIEKLNNALYSLNNSINSDKQLGYTLGGGLQFDIDYRKSIYIELRYNNLWGLESQTCGIKSTQCIIGINL